MAKTKILDIEEFEGGLNNHADPRDIAQDELALLSNLLTTNKGAIKIGYSISDVSTPADLTLSGLTAAMNGRNIYVYNSDFNSSNSEGASTYILFSNGIKLYRLEGSTWTEITTFTGSSQSLNPSVVVYDGNLRYSDGSFLRSSSSPYLNSNTTMFYGQLRRKYFNATVNNVTSKSVKASIIKPTNGKVNFNKSVEILANRPTQGTLGLEVNAIKNDVLEANTFGDSNPITVQDQNVTSSEVERQLNFAELGSIVADVTNQVMNDIYGTVYTEAQLQSVNSPNSQQFITSSIISGINHNAYRIGTQSNAVAFNYFFISVNPKNYNSIWGKDSEFSSTVANKSIRIRGKFAQYSSSSWSQANFSLMDFAPVIHKVNADGTIGSEISIISTDNDNNFKRIHFFDSDETTIYRVGIRTNTAEIIEITEIELKHHLATVSDDATNLKHLKTSVSGVSSFRLEMDALFNTAFQTADNLIAVKIAVPTLSAIGSIDFITTNNDNYSSSNNNLIFTLGADWISENKGMGWQDVIIDLNNIANIENNPVIGQLADFVIRVNYSVNTTETSIAIDSINQVTDNRGSWNGNYKFYYSWIYDRIQESGYYEFQNQLNGIYLQNERINVKALIKELSNGGFGDRAERITGANVYYKEWDRDRQEDKYDDPFLLIKCDFEKGVLKHQGTKLFGWNLGNVATDHYTHDAIQFIDPSLSSTYSISSGYEYNPLESIEEIRFKAFTNLNRRIYYGNVDILWEKFDGETNFKRNRYQDRVYKSLSNKPDIIPSYNYLDIDINDGDEITALASYADRLLVYKQNMMYLVNATQQVEYLEDKYMHKGVASNRGVVETDIGIAWVNTFGAYHYDGDNVKELSKSKLLQSVFNTDVGSNPNIVYEPKLRHLIITNSNGTNGYVYDLNVEAWAKTTSGLGSKNYNMVYYTDKVLSAVEASGSADFKELNISNASNESMIYELRTKDISFGSVGTRADVKAVYITYKGTISSSASVTVQYYKDKGSSPNAFTGGTLASSASGFTTAKLIPNPKSGSKKMHTIQLRITSSGSGGVGFKDFELHDLSIVYREKTIK